MPAFKFPGEDNIQFECNISLCENGAACAQLIVGLSVFRNNFKNVPIQFLKTPNLATEMLDRQEQFRKRSCTLA